jgi:hypothetical protein
MVDRHHPIRAIGRSSLSATIGKPIVPALAILPSMPVAQRKSANSAAHEW